MSVYHLRVGGFDTLFNQKIKHFLLASCGLLIGFFGCTKDLGTANRDTCITDNDCAIAASSCLPLGSGDTLKDYCFRGCPETWKNLDTKGMIFVCDVDSNGSGYADVQDDFVLNPGEDDECGFFASPGAMSNRSRGELVVNGLGEPAPCDAYPGLIESDGLCFPPLRDNNNNNSSTDAGVSGPSDTGSTNTQIDAGATVPTDSGTNNNPPDSGTNNNPPDSGTNNQSPDSGTNNQSPDSGTNNQSPDSGTNNQPPVSCSEVYNCANDCIDTSVDGQSFRDCETNCALTLDPGALSLYDAVINCSNNNCPITLGQRSSYESCMNSQCTNAVNLCLAN